MWQNILWTLSWLIGRPVVGLLVHYKQREGFWTSECEDVGYVVKVREYGYRFRYQVVGVSDTKLVQLSDISTSRPEQPKIDPRIAWRRGQVGFWRQIRNNWR